MRRRTGQQSDFQTQLISQFVVLLFSSKRAKIYIAQGESESGKIKREKVDGKVRQSKDIAHGESESGKIEKEKVDGKVRQKVRVER